MNVLEKKVLGPYRVVEKMGEGGMGAVYKGWDQKRKRFVAVKILTETVNKTYVDLFEREIQLLSTLDHPNIVPIYDVGWYMNIPYFVMGYLEGNPLLDVIILHQKKKTGFALPFFFAVFKDVVQALHHAHSKDIFHRDLKPENILISPKRRAFLLDFGLAKLLHDERIIPKNYILGTPQYMAPEQITNKEVDHRSDIYSLGMIMYVCLTGRLPFMDRDGMKGARRRLKEDFPPPSYRNKSVPRSIDDIVMRCVEREPKKRFQLISDVTLALSRVIDKSSSDQYKRVSRPIFLRKQGDEDEDPLSDSSLQVTPTALQFTRKPTWAATRLDEIIKLLEQEMIDTPELKYPYSCTFELLDATQAKDYPQAFGEFKQRSEEVRFLVITFENMFHLFIKFQAVILKCELHIFAAFARDAKEKPAISFELDLAGWEKEEDVDWQEVFRGLFSRFVVWSGT